MSDASELEALKARVKELEAAPVSGWGGLFSLVGSVVALVPRWLVVAAGVVAVAFIGAEAYLKIRAQVAETRITEGRDTLQNSDPLIGSPSTQRRIEELKLRIEADEKAAAHSQDMLRDFNFCNLTEKGKREYRDAANTDGAKFVEPHCP